jgi:hypothetical protein
MTTVRPGTSRLKADRTPFGQTAVHLVKQVSIENPRVMERIELSGDGTEFLMAGDG